MASKNNQVKLPDKVTFSTMAQHIAEKHQIPKNRQKIS